MTKSPNQFLTKWINFWVFVFCITVLAIGGHGGEAAIILLFTMAYIFTSRNDDRSKYKLNRDEIIFVTLVILFWLLNLLNTLFQPEGLEFENTKMALRAMDNPMRWILMLPIFFLLRRYKLDWRVISIGLSVGVLITVGVAAYEVYLLGNLRASGGMNHEITFGELMVAVDLLLWVLMIFAWNNNNKLLATILLIASLIAFYGSLLSVTRGAWIAYIFMIFSFVIYTFKRSISNITHLFSKPILIRIFLAFVVFFLVTQTEQYKVIEERTVNTFSNVSQGKYAGASGGRISIFNTAIEIFHHFPNGVGTDNFRTGGKAVIILDLINNENNVVTNQYNKVLDNDENIVVTNQYNEVLDNDDLKGIKFKKGDMHKYVFLQSYNEDGSKKLSSRWKHAHNEWLNVLAENGVAGFILLTLLFTFPIKIFWQNLSHENELIGAYSYSGILLIVSFTIFGQTQSIFTSHAAVIFFIFFLFLFIAQISKLNNIDDNNGSVS